MVRLTWVERDRCLRWGPGIVKTKSDLVVMPSGRQTFAVFCSPRDRRARNSGCGYTAYSFYTAKVIFGSRPSLPTRLLRPPQSRPITDMTARLSFAPSTDIHLAVRAGLDFESNLN